MSNNCAAISNSIQIFNILRNGPRTRNEIWELLGGKEKVKNSSLSDALGKLKEYGFLNPYKRKGEISLSEGPSVYTPFDPLIMRQWLILYNLRKTNYPVTYGSLLNSMQGYDIGFTESTLRDDIKDLIKAGYIESDTSEEPHHFFLTAKAPLCVDVTYEQLEFFALSWNVGIFTEFKQKVAERILAFAELTNSPIKVYGRKSYIEQHSINILQKLLNLPYNQKKLRITTSEAGSQHIAVAFGALIYYMETNDFYIIGKKRGKGKTEFSNIVEIRLSRIKEIECFDEKNKYYNDPEILRYIKEIFGMNHEKLQMVDICFEGSPEIRKHIDHLAIMRRKSKDLHIDWNWENTGKIYYHDAVPGLNYLKRFLRFVGPDATIPDTAINQSLIREMKDTCSRVRNHYKEQGEQPDFSDMQELNDTAVYSNPVNYKNVFEKLTSIFSLLGFGQKTLTEAAEFLQLRVEELRMFLLTAANSTFFRDHILVNGNFLDRDVIEKIENGEMDDQEIVFDNQMITGEEKRYLLPVNEEEYPWISEWFGNISEGFYIVSTLLGFDDKKWKKQALEEKIQKLTYSIDSEDNILFYYPGYHRSLVGRPINLKTVNDPSGLICECMIGDSRCSFDVDKLNVLQYQYKNETTSDLEVSAKEVDWDTIWRYSEYETELEQCEDIVIQLYYVRERNNILRKIQADIAGRKYGRIIMDGKGDFYYVDRVSGFHHFRQWVRSYGSSMKVLKPGWLAQAILEDYDQMDKNY